MSYTSIYPSRIPSGMSLEGVMQDVGGAKHLTPLSNNSLPGRQALRIRPGDKFSAKVTWPCDQKAVTVHVFKYDRNAMNGRQRKILDEILRRISRDKIRRRRRDEQAGVECF